MQLYDEVYDPMVVAGVATLNAPVYMIQQGIETDEAKCFWEKGNPHLVSSRIHFVHR